MAFQTWEGLQLDNGRKVKYSILPEFVLELVRFFGGPNCIPPEENSASLITTDPDEPTSSGDGAAIDLEAVDLEVNNQ